MRFNKYTRLVGLEQEKCLYNTYNGSVVTLSNDYFNQDMGLVENIDKNKIHGLYELEMLEDSEQTILDNLVKQYNNESKTLILTIELTRRCNLHCAYCYENGLRNDSIISDDIINQIVCYVESIANKKDIRLLKINYMGGEPLLAKNQMLKIHQLLEDLCKKKKIEMKSLLNTNGVLLTKDFLNLFKNMEVSITLSNKEDHDAVRTYENGKGSFDIILKNIKDCKEVFEREDINLDIRFNTNGNNYMFFENFLDMLLATEVKIKQVEPMYTLEHEQNDFKNTLSRKDFLIWNSTIALDALLSRGFKIYYSLPTVLKPCKAYINDNCKIYADGNMRLCDASDYADRGPKLEEVLENPELFNTRYKTFKEWNPFKHERCKTCENLILCGGDYFCRDGRCDFERYNVDLFIKKYVEYVKNGKDYMFVNM